MTLYIHKILIVTFLVFLYSHDIKSNPGYFSTITNDTLNTNPDSLSLVTETKTGKQIRKEKKAKRRDELKHSHNRLFIHGAYIFASLDSKVTFSPPNSMINVTLDLEENLGLPSNSSFFSGSAIYRFTPSSGLYVNYYGFNRKHDHFTKQDIIWGGDTIPAGTKSQVYFRTQVFSAGYLLSILKNQDSFLGTYINFYIMPLDLGLRTQITHKDYNLSVTVPLPNLGIVAMFKLTKWLSVYGNAGFFSLYTKSLGGYIQDLNISFPIKITRWLGISANYQYMFVHAIFPDQKIDTFVDYKFQGPAVGVTLNF
jgi:hypothetical protein